MPRKARIVLAKCPHHVVQRGHNRQRVFRRTSDYQRYLEDLQAWKTELGCRVYAYCLMSDHVHLIIDPGDQSANLARLMKSLAGGFARYVNMIEGRTGSLWDSRYRSSPIERERYLLPCCRYVELNPVRAELVDNPESYPWSSYRARTGNASQCIIDLDPCYLALGWSPTQRAGRYCEYVAERPADSEYALIRAAVQRGQLTGSRRFVDEVARMLGRRIELRGRGRPSNNSRTENNLVCE